MTKLALFGYLTLFECAKRNQFLATVKQFNIFNSVQGKGRMSPSWKSSMLWKDWLDTIEIISFLKAGMGLQVFLSLFSISLWKDMKHWNEYRKKFIRSFWTTRKEPQLCVIVKSIYPKKRWKCFLSSISCHLELINLTMQNSLCGSKLSANIRK